MYSTSQLQIQILMKYYMNYFKETGCLLGKLPSFFLLVSYHQKHIYIFHNKIFTQYTKKMINKNFLYAVIGASNDKKKYGYKVFKSLLDAEYKVIPININEKEILWKKVYANISETKKNIDVVIFVTQPKVTEHILEEANTLHIKKARFQPWSQSDKAIEFCKKNDIECIYNACIMIKK